MVGVMGCYKLHNCVYQAAKVMVLLCYESLCEIW